VCYKNMRLEVIWINTYGDGSKLDHHSIHCELGKLLADSAKYMPPDGEYTIELIYSVPKKIDRYCAARRLNLYCPVAIRSVKTKKRYYFLNPPNSQWVEDAPSARNNPSLLREDEATLMTGYHCPGSRSSVADGLCKRIDPNCKKIKHNMLGQDRGGMYMGDDPIKTMHYAGDAVKVVEGDSTHYKVTVLHVASVLARCRVKLASPMDHCSPNSKFEEVSVDSGNAAVIGRLEITCTTDPFRE
jgi:hypothetical protein